MANLIRGEVPFRALGRDLFVQYGPRELAEIQAALGFRRPDPFQPEMAEEVDVAVEEGGQPKLDERGLQVFERRRILVDAVERQRRMLAAFESVWMNPDPEATLVCFRIGLNPWERQNAKIANEAFEAMVRELGLMQIKVLHMQAITFGVYLKGGDVEDGGESQGKAERVVSASTT